MIDQKKLLHLGTSQKGLRWLDNHRPIEMGYFRIWWGVKVEFSIGWRWVLGRTSTWGSSWTSHCSWLMSSAVSTGLYRRTPSAYRISWHYGTRAVCISSSWLCWTTGTEDWALRYPRGDVDCVRCKDNSLATVGHYRNCPCKVNLVVHHHLADGQDRWGRSG